MVQLGDVKKQSSISNKGDYSLLVQVKRLPFKGSSTKPKALIVSLDVNMSE